MQISPWSLKVNRSKYTLIDVRELDELGGIDGALRVPLGRLIRDFGSFGFGDKELVIYCMGGVRGGVAVEFLIKKGYKALNLEGGLRAYNNLNN